MVSLASSTVKSFEFLAYLQGIETSLYRYQRTPCQPFLAYLQGIETRRTRMN